MTGAGVIESQSSASVSRTDVPEALQGVNLNLTPKMRDALYIAANTGGIIGTKDGDWRYGNYCAVRTAWALEKRGLIERQWTGNATDRWGAPFLITPKGRALAEALTLEEPEGWED